MQGHTGRDREPSQFWLAQEALLHRCMGKINECLRPIALCLLSIANAAMPISCARSLAANKKCLMVFDFLVFEKVSSKDGLREKFFGAVRRCHYSKNRESSM
jgi:hypothetical protein